ncbi:MAG: 2'-5' RNA ligase family protein [Flavisolibacter sp.]
MLNNLLIAILLLIMGELSTARHIVAMNEFSEYLLVAFASKEVAEKVKDEKESFTQAYGSNSSLELRPHITVASYTAKERMEERLEKWIQNICNLQTSFSVTLNNYSGFPPHTVYLRVQNAEPFTKLANGLKMLDGFMEINDCPLIQLCTKPYMTVVGQLPASIYEAAIKDYAAKSFHDSFRVDRLSLLKCNPYTSYNLVNTFILPTGATVTE